MWEAFIRLCHHRDRVKVLFNWRQHYPIVLNVLNAPGISGQLFNIHSRLVLRKHSFIHIFMYKLIHFHIWSCYCHWDHWWSQKTWRWVLLFSKNCVAYSLLNAILCPTVDCVRRGAWQIAYWVYQSFFFFKNIAALSDTDEMRGLSSNLNKTQQWLDIY